MLILCEVLRWKAIEVAELLETTVASVNSALQRARATLDDARSRGRRRTSRSTSANRELLARYVDAFERYDIESLTTLLHEDATLSMPPYELWLQRPRRHPRLVVRAGHRLQGVAPRGDDLGERLARVRAVPPGGPNGSYTAWALQVLELSDGGIGGVHVLPRHRDAVPALRAADHLEP